MAGATRTIEVDVSREEFFAVIRDYESYPDFLPEMESARIRKTEGQTVEVDFTLNLIKRIRYTLALTDDPPNGLSWTLREGMFKSNEGAWKLEDLPGGRTLATYTVNVAVGIFVPGSIVNRLVGQTLPATLEAFKARAELLHRS